MTLTTAELEDLVCAPLLTVGFGAELLDDDDVLVEDISDDLVAGQVQHNNFDDVHGNCRLSLLREPSDNARVRVYQTLTAGGVTERFNLGLFILTSPKAHFGTLPAAYDVTGLDKLSLLLGEVGDTYNVGVGTGYLDAVRQAITDAGVTGSDPLFDGTADATVTPAEMCWVLNTKDPTTWLGLINDLLKPIAYVELYANADGRLCSEPWIDPNVRTPLWTLDTTDPLTDILDPKRVLATETGLDTRASVNWWRFVMDGLTAAPSEGTTMYTVDESGAGTKHKRVLTRDAADYAALVALGDKIVQEDSQSMRTVQIGTHPLPILGHLDVISLNDPNGAGLVKCQVRSHTTALKPPRVSITLEVLD